MKPLSTARRRVEEPGLMTVVMAFGIVLLSGCSCIAKHPRTAAVIGSVLITSVLVSTQQHGRTADLRVGVSPLPNCAARPESCK